MNDELERFWKEPLLPVDVVPRHMSAGPDENHKNTFRIADDETGTQEPSTAYPCTTHFGGKNWKTAIL